MIYMNEQNHVERRQASRFNRLWWDLLQYKQYKLILVSVQMVVDTHNDLQR